MIALTSDICTAAIWVRIVSIVSHGCAVRHHGGIVGHHGGVVGHHGGAVWHHGGAGVTYWVAVHDHLGQHLCPEHQSRLYNRAPVQQHALYDIQAMNETMLR